MKKIVSLLISMLILTTSVFAEATFPAELMSYPENFTATSKVTLSIDDNKDIRGLIEELAENEEMEYIFGLGFGNLLTALIDYNGTIEVKSDVSPDLKKIKLSMEISNVLNSKVSQNLNYTVNAKGGYWLDVDLTNTEAPKADYIFLLPTSDKYCYINAGKFIPTESLPLLSTYLSPELTEKVTAKYYQMLADNSKIEKIGSKYKLTMNNENMLALIKEVVNFNPLDDGIEADEIEFPEDYDKLQILGKDGITATYTIKNGKITIEEVSADISLNVANIVTTFGGEWEYESEGIINIKIAEKTEYTKIDTTTVTYPVLTDKNSICLNSMLEEAEEEADYYEYEMEYPYNYVSIETDTLPYENGNYYIPLRAVLEDAYEDTISIGYEKGVITLTSEHFDRFKTLSLNTKENKVYQDGVHIAAGDIKNVNGTTYVDTFLFTEVFGWDLTHISHFMLDDIYSVSFYTVKW